MPKVSIIVPCYNQAQFLEEALHSVLEQTYTHWECIIVNDGSQDGTEAVAKAWVEKDSRFNYLYKDNGGLSSARNAGIGIAQGEYILPLDADDKIAPNYVALAVQSFQEDAFLKVVYCKAEKFGLELGELILNDFSLKQLSIKNMIFCSALFKRKDWQAIGGYDIQMIHGLEDWEFWINLLKNSGRVKRLNEVCFFYRIKNNSMLKDLNNEGMEYSLKYLSIKHADFFVNQLGTFISLNQKIQSLDRHFYKLTKSKKFAIDVFCNSFFGFTFFDTIKK